MNDAVGIQKALRASFDEALVVFENDEGRATVLAVDPLQSVAALGNPGLDELAGELKQKLVRALDRLEAS